MMLNKEKNFASAVIYVHNAELRIKTFLQTIMAVMEENFEHSEIICVNDASDDNSLGVIREVSKLANSASVSIVNMSYFHGLELSMKAGMDLAIGDFVFEFDNTILDFAPQEVMRIYRKSLEGYDIVSASADRKERFASCVFYRIFQRYTKLSHKITTESFRILSRRVINRVDAMNKTIPYRKVIYASCGLKTDNIRYRVTCQYAETTDKREKKFRTDLAIDSLILFTRIGYSFSKLMTICMMLMSLFMTVYSIAIYVTASPVTGWTTTILFLSVAFFGLFGILTVVIKYLQLLIDLVFKRKQYSFESIEKLTR